MRTQLYWIDGPWIGKLAISARPRGGDWLDEEMAAWRRAGVSAVVSLLTLEEEADLDLANERNSARTHDMKFLSLPIPDREAPPSEQEFVQLLDAVEAELTAGRSVVLHCRQGVGRSGVIAACLLLKKGISPGAAVDSVSAVRGVSVPETAQQREWIEHYASALAGFNRG